MGNKVTKTYYGSRSQHDIERQDRKNNSNNEIDNCQTENVPIVEIVKGKKSADFQKRKCVKFVKPAPSPAPAPADPENKPNVCAHCKKDMRFHREEIVLEVNNQTRPKLYEQCTEEETTDAYGELLFSSANCKKAKYIKVKTDTPIEEMTRYLFSETGFNLRPPKLIISVTGGAQSFAIDEETKFALKYGLMKIASSTDAWIISGGTNFGVMRLVGDAVAEEFQNEELPVIGIASWGVVCDENLNIPKKTEEDSNNHYVVRYFSERNESMVPINPNHSHFIFVDDGSYKEFGVEIDFRTNLEAYVQRFGNVDMNNNNRMAPDKIPMVLIVVRGGPNTLLTIDNALKSDIPVILLANSGGAADMVIKARERSMTSSNAANLDARLKQLVESPGFEVYRSDEEVKSNTMRLLTNIVNESYRRLLNVFKMRTAGSGKNIEPTVLEALSKAETKIYKRIQFAIKWDRFDIAKVEMKKHALANIEKSKSEEYLTKTELENLLELALIENKPKFVELILENEINLIEFSTVRRLENFYNNELKQKKVKNEEPFLLCLEMRRDLSQKGDVKSKFDKKFGPKKLNLITPKIIRKFLKSLFSTFEPNKFLPTNFDDDNLENRFAEQELNLFLWCILSNRIEIGKIFWRLGKYQICYALMASKVLKHFASHLPDLEEDLLKSADDFEDLAIGVIRVFDENTRDAVNDTLIIRYLEPVKMDCLELAVECDSTKFLSQPKSIQKAMDNLWYGKTYDNTELTEFEKSLRECQQRLNNTKNYIFNNEIISQSSKDTTYWQHFISFLNIPFVHFILHTIFYILFLGVFSYVLLFNYKYPEKVVENGTFITQNSDKNNNNESHLKPKSITFNAVIPNLNISGFEIILLLWIFSLFFEEIRQFLKINKFSQTSWTYKIITYLQDDWNLLDVLGCFLFVVGFILKAISLKASEGVFIWARIILSIDLVIWFIRGLNFCLLIQSLGPKLVMIRKMINDLKYFMIIVSTFVFAFGISLKAIMDSQSSFNAKTLLDVLTIAYWPIYGEITLLEKVNEENCNPEEGVCADSHSKMVSYLLLMAYLLIANVLLLNILIAMFSSTFESIQNNSALIWKNQRYHLISEYTDSPILPAPFSLINYVWYGIKKIKYKLTHISEQLGDDQIDSSDNRRQTQNLDALMDYEQKCTQKLLKEMRSKMNEIEENKVAVLNDKIEALEKQLQELAQITKGQHNELLEARPVSEPSTL